MSLYVMYKETKACHKLRSLSLPHSKYENANQSKTFVKICTICRRKSSTRIRHVYSIRTFASHIVPTIFISIPFFRFTVRRPLAAENSANKFTYSIHHTNDTYTKFNLHQESSAARRFLTLMLRIVQSHSHTQTQISNGEKDQTIDIIGTLVVCQCTTIQHTYRWKKTQWMRAK